MAGLLFLPLGLAGFGLFFAPVWFQSQNLPLALAAGGLGAAVFYAWARRILTRGLTPWALEHLALRQLHRRGSVEPGELAELAGVPETRAREVLDDLVRRGLARKERGRYRR